MTATVNERLELLKPQGPAFASRLRDFVYADGPGGDGTVQPEYNRFDTGVGDLAGYIAHRYGSAGDQWTDFLHDAMWEVGREAAIDAMIREAGEWLANRADVELRRRGPGRG